MSRKKARETLMKIIYRFEMNKGINENEISNFLSEEKVNEDQVSYVTEGFRYITDNLEEIDNTINKHSSTWNVKRIAKIDLSLLRIALFEMKNREDIPVQVSINEALELSKTYSNIESYKYINGVLGSFVREYSMNK